MTAVNSKIEEKNEKLGKLENIIDGNNATHSSHGVSNNSYSPLQPVEETGLPHQTDGAANEENVDHHTSEESSQNRFRFVDNSEDSGKTDERLKMHSLHDHSRQKTSKNVSDEDERNQTSVGHSVVDDSAEDQSKENSEMRYDGMILQRKVKSQVTHQLSSKEIDLHNSQVAASRFESLQETKRNSESMSRNENDDIEEDGGLSRVKSKSFKLSEKTLKNKCISYKSYQITQGVSET